MGKQSDGISGSGLPVPGPRKDEDARHDVSMGQ